MKTLLAALLFLTPTAALAEQIESQAGYSSTRKCLKSEYREEYVPGTEDEPGYVKSWKDTYEVECDSGYVNAPSYKRSVTVHEEIDTNDCSGGTLVGGLLGGGLGAALSRDDGRWWAIPIGVASGAMVGCQVDGG